MRICFKFEEENAEKDTETTKKERFDAIMGMMQVTLDSKLPNILRVVKAKYSKHSKIKTVVTGDASPWPPTQGADRGDG